MYACTDVDSVRSCSHAGINCDRRNTKVRRFHQALFLKTRLAGAGARASAFALAAGRLTTVVPVDVPDAVDTTVLLLTVRIPTLVAPALVDVDGGAAAARFTRAAVASDAALVAPRAGGFRSAAGLAAARLAVLPAAFGAGGALEGAVFPARLEPWQHASCQSRQALASGAKWSAL